MGRGALADDDPQARVAASQVSPKLGRTYRKRVSSTPGWGARQALIGASSKSIPTILATRLRSASAANRVA